MSEFNEGDRVRLTKGDTVIETIATKRVAFGENYVWLLGRSPIGWIHDGYTIELVKAALKPLPTEGWWYDKIWGQGNIYHFEFDGEPIVSVYRLLDQWDIPAAEKDDMIDGTEEWVRIDDANA